MSSTTLAFGDERLGHASEEELEETADDVHVLPLLVLEVHAVRTL